MENETPNSVTWHKWPNDGRYAMVITYKGEVFPPMGAYASKEAAIMAGEQRLRAYKDTFVPPWKADTKS